MRFKLFKKIVIVVLLFLVSFSNLPFQAISQALLTYQETQNIVDKFWNVKSDSNVIDNLKLFELAKRIEISKASAATTANGTTWYLSNTNASVAHGTVGPTAEFAASNDVTPAVPTLKTTAKAMIDTPGTAATTVGGVIGSGVTWYRTFLSPKLAAQSIASGMTFKLELAATESSASANAYTRVNVYTWREGTGKITTLIDGTGANCVTATEYGTSGSGRTCVTGAAAAATLQDGDQIAVEVWVQAVTGYTENILYGGPTQVIHNGANTNPMSSFSTSRAVILQTAIDKGTRWFLSNTNASVAHGTVGPTAEFATSNDVTPAVPTLKTTAKAMIDTPGTAATTVGGVIGSGVTWYRTFLSPKLAAQSIASGMTFKLDLAATESSASANAYTRVNVYTWREGTGKITTLIDGTGANCVTATEYGTSGSGRTCVTGAAAAATLQDGDQIAVEIWVQAVTGYTENILYGGPTFITHSVANTNPMSSFTTSRAVNLQLTSLPVSYTLTYAAGAGGTISGTSPQTVDSGSDGTQVTAVPNTGYSFIQWSDGVMTAARTDLNVTDDKSVTAQFTINTYTLTYTAGTGGTITGTSPQSVLYNNNGTQVTAVANTGYTFSQWSDGVMTAARTDTSVTTNKSVTAQFTANNYTLTYAAGAGGSLTGSTSQNVNHGSNGTQVTAVPDTGYSFIQWSDGVMTAARTDTNVTANKSVTAQFAINTYTLNYAAGAGGTLTGTASQNVNYGSNGTQVTAVPNTGYSFIQWSDGVLTAARTDTNVTANKSVTAQFTINTYTLTYTAGTGGTITGTSPQSVLYNNNGTQVTAVANTGYTFSQWSDGVMTAARTDTSVTANKSVTAQFTIKTYTLNYAAGAGGTLTGTASQVVNYNANGTQVTAVPNTGYTFSQWSDGVMTAARTDLNVTANKSVTAQFAINTYTLTYTAGAGGTLTGTASQVVNYNANGTQVTAVPNTGYSFIQWSDGVMTAARTDLNVTANKSVTAQFTINTYTLTYTAGTGGTITGTSPQSVLYNNNGTQVTAVANTGYTFSQWSDGVMTAARTDLNVAANKSVTAQFTINTYTLTYTAGSGGTLTGTASQVVNYNANGTQVTAVPNTGYSFIRWSDNVMTAARTDTNVTANKSVTAQFSVNSYTVNYSSGSGGTISGNTSQNIMHGNGGSSVTAVANTGYHFVQWSDGNSNPSRSEASVISNLSIVAQFALDNPGGNTTGAKILKNSSNKMVVGSLQQGLVLDLPLRNKYTKSSTVGSEIFTDRTPYSNDGQNYGASTGASGTTFNGLGDYIKISIKPSLQPQNNLTLSAWVKPNATFSGDVIILGQSAYSLTVASDWSVKAYWYGKNPEGFHSTAAGVVTPGSWNLITAVWSNTNVKLYVNGVLKTTVACTGTGAQAINQVWIGAENNGITRRFKGDISGVLIYNQVVSESDIRLLYSRGLVDASAIIY